jgi:hypothetical protein
MKKLGAPAGIKHGKAKATFEEVEACRKMHEEGFNAKYISNQTGIALDTVRDWIYYRTRHYA